MKRTEPPLKCSTMAVQIKKDSSLIHFVLPASSCCVRTANTAAFAPAGKLAGQRLWGEPYKFLSELGPLCAMRRGLFYCPCGPPPFCFAKRDAGVQAAAVG